MRKMLRTYFTHLPNWIFILATGGVLYFLYNSGLLWSHYYWLLMAPVPAPLVEWLIHKFILHFEASKNSWVRHYMEDLHYQHHVNPRDLKYVFAPLSSVVVGGLVLYGIMTLCFWSGRVSLVPMAGAGLYYLFYEWVHLGHHVDGYHHLTPYGKLMKKAHTWHHYKNENYWWGVTNHLGDVFLRTFPDPKAVEKTGSSRSIFENLGEEKSDSNS